MEGDYESVPQLILSLRLLIQAVFNKEMMTRAVEEGNNILISIGYGKRHTM